MKNSAALTLSLLLGTGLLSPLTQAAGDPEAGAKIFPRLCGGCHQVGESARPGFGPQLNGIIGRAAGTSANYVYSDAMKNSGLTWDRQTLIAYLKDPKGVVPGTRMIFWGLSDEEKLNNLLAYLQTFSQ
ncbi:MULTISPECIES: c-type cytochrome [unclassified Pseudomonas]|uniref:c-type cytochrome n=1 Tax=unclassified Pseudomonas TaxID=196821 RepID=UPI00215CBC57|nr:MULTISPECIES: cytochrome c family protein [unclassified Pseudomonas]MCR8930655.1 cytochrome c family protein [Pseudomonas sp. S11A4]MCR8974257.1 cytochrome c family protein [Pseudomonas sp. S11P7]